MYFLNCQHVIKASISLYFVKRLDCAMRTKESRTAALTSFDGERTSDDSFYGPALSEFIKEIQTHILPPSRTKNSFLSRIQDQGDRMPQVPREESPNRHGGSEA